MTRIHTLIALAIAASLMGCAAPGSHHEHEGAMDKGEMHEGHMHQMMESGGMAVATLTPTQGNSVRGLIMFHEMHDHLMVHAHISGLAPNSEHGFHLHDVGNCASPDGTSAGGHFNPAHTAHGPQDAEHHAGDLPSLKADADGVVDQKFMLHGVGLKEGPTSIDGRSVVLHANPDDYKTQPAGNAGPRIACGVVASMGQHH
jgi:Cu-Zn family superoxide dismutase